MLNVQSAKNSQLAGVNKSSMSSRTFSKGVAKPRNSGSQSADVTTLNTSWFYNWWYDEATVGNSQYVPMVFGDWESLSSSTPAQIKAATNTTILLGFNEPDNASQANMTTSRALALWPSLEATGCRLGSPAVSAGGTGLPWLATFMAGNPRVDFICLHWYPDFSSQTLSELITTVYGLYKKPIWITEISKLTGTLAENSALVTSSINTIKQYPYVERVAWYATYGSDGYDNAALIIPDFTFGSSGNWPGMWANYSSTTGASSTAVSAWGRQTTGVIGSYGDVALQRLNNVLTADITISIDCKITDVNECFPFIRFRSADDPANSYDIQFQPTSANILVRRIVAGSATTLNTLGFAYTVNDIFHVEIVMSGNVSDIKIWKNSDSKPGSPTATINSATFATQKRLFLGLNGGNATTARTVEWRITSSGLGTGGALNTAGQTYAALGREITHLK